MSGFLNLHTLEHIHYYVNPFVRANDSRLYMEGMHTEVIGIPLWAKRSHYYGDDFTKVLMRFLPDTAMTERTWEWSVRWLPNGQNGIGFYGNFELYKKDIAILKTAIM